MAKKLNLVKQSILNWQIQENVIKELSNIGLKDGIMSLLVVIYTKTKNHIKISKSTTLEKIRLLSNSRVFTYSDLSLTHQLNKLENMKLSI